MWANLPSKWTSAKFGEIADFKNGLNFKANEKGSRIKVLGVGDFQSRSEIKDLSLLSEVPLERVLSEDYLLRDGDLVFVRSNGNKALVGRCVIVYPGKQKLSYSGFTIRARLTTDKVSPSFISLLMQTGLLKAILKKEGGGTNISNLNQVILTNLDIPIPPIHEQQTITCFLSTWDSAIEKTEKLIEATETRYKWLLDRLITQESKKGKWKKVKLGEVADIRTGSRDNQNKTENGEYPFFVRSQIIERIDSYSFNGEAILIPGEGKIGKIVHYINGKFDYHQRVYKISDFADAIHGQFLFYYLKCCFPKQAAKHTVKATADSLRLPAFTKMNIYFPPIEKQQKIAKILSTAQQEIELLKRLNEKYKTQKRGLMQKLLTGQWRVKKSVRGKE